MGRFSLKVLDLELVHEYTGMQVRHGVFESLNIYLYLKLVLLLLKIVTIKYIKHCGLALSSDFELNGEKHFK